MTYTYHNIYMHVLSQKDASPVKCPGNFVTISILFALEGDEIYQE